MSTKVFVRGALLLAIAVILPQFFHLLGGDQLGRMLLPMHLPVYLSGFILGPFMGVMVGALAPLLSHALTGMPPVSPPVLFLMLIELPVYGFFSGLLFNKYRWPLIYALLLTMLLGRLAMSFGAPVFFKLLDFPLSPMVYLQGALLAGIPGALLQVIVIPLIFRRQAILRLLER